MPHLQKGSSKLLNAWAFYDWANSVYSLVITSAIFPIFYASLFKIKKSAYVELFGISFKNTALISFVTAIAFLIIAIISPILSGIADHLGNKKSFMKFFCYLGSFSCIGLYFFNLENITISLIFYFFGLIGFWGSIVFYNSYLPDIAYVSQQDAISAKGYSLGYIGSVLLLIINLAMVMKPDFFGITNEIENANIKAMRYSFIMVGIWWAGFSQYTYLYLPNDKKQNEKIKRGTIFLNGFIELKKVWQQLKNNDILKKYLLGFFVYSMAVQTVMLIATYFGEQEINWENDDQKNIGLIVSILLIQLIAVLGAIITSNASKKFGNIKTLIFINMMWLIICFVAYFIYSPTQFYLTAAFVGLVMGGIQSLSRSTYSKLIPKTNDSTSFFSFYDVTEKIGIVFGIFIYGLVEQITGRPRLAIAFLALFFFIGILLLNRIPKKILETEEK